MFAPLLLSRQIMKLLITTLALFGIVSTGQTATAQGHGAASDVATDSAKAEVMASVQALFTAMRSADGEAVKAVFADDARLQSAARGEAGPVLRATPIDGFAKSVSGSTEGDFDEQSWDVEILIDGDLASAWVPYAFFYKGKFSHCGVNAVQLHKGAAGWKIIQLTDTRRSDGCDLPPHLQSDSN